MFTFIKKGLFCLILLLITISTAFAQSYKYSDYRRLSILLRGGATLGDMNRSNYFLASDFSVNTKSTPAFGAGLQYALTPTWSLELGYQYTNIKGKENEFKTNMNIMSLKNIFNLNQIFSVNRISNRFNPFLTAGFDYDMFTYRGSDKEFSKNNLSYNAGLGIAFKLNNTLDLFTQYEFHIASNSSDNEVGGYNVDYINLLTSGIRINFGKKESPHLSWREVPAEISPSDYNHFMAQSETINKLENKLDQLAQRQNEKEQEYEQIVDEKSAEIESLKERMNRMNSHSKKLEKMLTERLKEIQKVNVDSETGFAASLPSGDYVQIFATYYPEIARQVRNNALQSLEDKLPNAQQKIFIIQRKKFYEVLIGVFNDYEKALSVQNVMKHFHNDTFVITFPRPVNLRQDFDGLKIMNDRPLIIQNRPGF